MTRPPQQPCRTSLREICEHNNSNSPINKGPEMTKRVSARILFREKLKSISVRKPPQHLREDDGRRSDDPSQIEPWNPSHKLSFLRLLGLFPKSGQGSQTDVHTRRPIVQLERLDDFMVFSKCSKTTTQLSCPPKVEENVDEIWINSDSEDDDLDLDLVFCPLDIPEIYEEITKKPFPNPPPPPSKVPSSSHEKFHNFNSSSSESGYDSPMTAIGSRVSYPMMEVGPRFHYQSRNVLNNDDELSDESTFVNNHCSRDNDDDDCVIIDEIWSPFSPGFSFCDNVKSPFLPTRNLFQRHDDDAFQKPVKLIS